MLLCATALDPQADAQYQPDVDTDKRAALVSCFPPLSFQGPIEEGVKLQNATTATDMQTRAPLQGERRQVFLVRPLPAFAAALARADCWIRVMSTCQRCPRILQIKGRSDAGDLVSWGARCLPVGL